MSRWTSTTRTTTRRTPLKRKLAISSLGRSAALSALLMLILLICGLCWSLTSWLLLKPRLVTLINSYHCRWARLTSTTGRPLRWLIGPQATFRKAQSPQAHKPASNFPWTSDMKSGFHDCNFRECGTLLWMGRSPRGGYPRWLFPETFQSQTFWIIPVFFLFSRFSFRFLKN